MRFWDASADQATPDGRAVAISGEKVSVGSEGSVYVALKRNSISHTLAYLIGAAAGVVKLCFTPKKKGNRYWQVGYGFLRCR